MDLGWGTHPEHAPPTPDFLLPVNEVCESYVFARVCLSMGGLVLGVACSRGWSGPRGIWSQRGGGLVPGGCGDPRTATTAGGTHSTGMHSCIFYISSTFSKNFAQSYVGTPPCRVGAPFYGESWICPCGGILRHHPMFDSIITILDRCHMGFEALTDFMKYNQLHYVVT